MAFYGLLVLCTIIACATTLYPIGLAYNNALSVSRIYNLYSESVLVRTMGESIALGHPAPGPVQYQNWLAVLESSSIQDGLNVNASGSTIVISEIGGSYAASYKVGT